MAISIKHASALSSLFHSPQVISNAPAQHGQWALKFMAKCQNAPLTFLDQWNFPLSLKKTVLLRVKSRLSIQYIEGSQVITSKKIFVFLSLKINFVLAKSSDPDKMTPYGAFHRGLHCLQMYT